MPERICANRLDLAMKNGGVCAGDVLYRPGYKSGIVDFRATVRSVYSTEGGLCVELEPGRHFIRIDPHSMDSYYLFTHPRQPDLDRV